MIESIDYYADSKPGKINNTVILLKIIIIKELNNNGKIFGKSKIRLASQKILKIIFSYLLDIITD